MVYGVGSCKVLATHTDETKEPNMKNQGYQIHSTADNTGWEGEVFATLEEAERAIELWKDLVGGNHRYEIAKVSKAPTMTFDEWNSLPVY